MRLLVDENLALRIAKLLRDGGFDAIHVLEGGLGGCNDHDVSDFATTHQRAVISADSDFATLLALSAGSSPSLVLLRSSDRLSPVEQASLLLANLPALEADLARGAVVSLGPQHLRVRPLPLR